jgi:hypothetical protein
MTGRIVVEAGDVGADDIRAAWAEILAEAARPDSSPRGLVEAHEADADELDGASVEVTPLDGDGGLTLVVAIGAPLATHVLISLWDDYVRPRIRKNTGEDAGDAKDGK